MPDGNPLQVSALCIAEGVRAGRLSAEGVVVEHIRRVERVNGAINALVAERFEAAVAEARGIDALPGVERGKLPLAGVPFSAKEMVAVAGMPATFGCRNRESLRARADATVVARARAAGAILLGVTNVPEWGMWYETYNHVYGRTSNPHDVGRTAGGSSGGEAALLAAGGAAFGIGTDIGGSIRMPAAFCGVHGHKPTHGLLPLTGIHPVYADEGDAPLARSPAGPLRPLAPYLSAGVFTRSARDVAVLLRVLAGPDGMDPNAEAVPLHDPGSVDWRGRRVVMLPAPGMKLARPASGDVTNAVREAGAVLAAHGAEVEEASPSLMERAGDIWFSALQEAGGPSFAVLLGAGRRVRAVPEVARALVGRSQYSWPALFFVLGELIGQRGERGMRSARAEAQRVAAEFTALCGDDGVFLMPVHPRVAPRHNAPVLRPFDFLYTGIFNALRVPAASVPFGFDGAGLPLAVQVAAARGRDHLAMAAAIALEDALPPWRPAGP